jgi:uncharacterized protein (DUF58 family)
MSRLLLAAGLLLLLLFAYLTAIRSAYVLVYGLALVFLLAYFWPRQVIRRIQVTRRIDTGTPTVGEAFEESFTAQKVGWVPAPWVEIRDLSEIPGYQPGRIVSLGDPVTWTHRGTYRHRGWLTFGPTRVKVQEPFGLFSRETRLNERHKVLVYPRIRPMPEFMVPAEQHSGDARLLSSAWADYPPETSGVRDYAEGDSLGRIHWKLSAKYGQMISKTFEQPLTSDLLILLDLQRSAHHGKGEESTLEYAISLAASINAQVHSQGRQVGLITNDSRGTILTPHRAFRLERAMLEYLAVAQADGDLPIGSAQVWDRVRRLPGRMLAVITPSADATWLRNLEAIPQKRTARVAFYIDAASFGAAEPHLTFDLHTDVDLFVVRRGDDFSRLMKTRNAVRLV